MSTQPGGMGVWTPSEPNDPSGGGPNGANNKLVRIVLKCEGSPVVTQTAVIDLCDTPEEDLVTTMMAMIYNSA